ncbi:hypothetical protein AHiyo6_33230, partial [Arthrobacter sp. Hiyo6]
MSKEQPPIRSRRELRRARDERAESNPDIKTDAPGQVSPAAKPQAPQP